MKRILFAASECVPFIKTGGLADVCGALPKEFSKEEWDVRVVIPNYSCIPEKYRSQFQYVTHFYMCAGNYIQNKYVGILKYELDGVTYYFIDNQEYFTCDTPYGDIRYDIEKFVFFDKAFKFFRLVRIIVDRRKPHAVLLHGQNRIGGSEAGRFQTIQVSQTGVVVVVALLQNNDALYLAGGRQPHAD